MIDIEKNILKRKYSFSKVMRAPGYPVVDFLMYAGPFSQKPNAVTNFRIVTEDELDVPNKQSDTLYNTFTVRGGLFKFLSLLN